MHMFARNAKVSTFLCEFARSVKESKCDILSGVYFLETQRQSIS